MRSFMQRAVAMAVAGSSFYLPSAWAEEDEAWNAHFQATYVHQQHGGFPALYSGPNSLLAVHERSYSFSATAYLGMRLGEGTEVYADPEVVQAVPFSNLTGLGGLTNAENQKTAGPTPTWYRARLFARHTWGLGGGKESVESDANQLAGEIDKRRIVLTAGNVAAIDIFDAGPYSHDPRTQLLNWAFMTHGAYDFAADARGYTWGTALEYYFDDWVVRAGRFLEPRESNGLKLDYRIMAHHGDQIEIERACEIAGHPGTVRLLLFRNVARMGNFKEALEFAATHGGVPDVANVRRDQAKWGMGAGIDQKLSESVGFFARASWNDGASETYAFTEIERSVAAGADIKGRAWDRPDDVLLLGLARNGLSAAHRDYLAAGGLGFFIGDGRLTYEPELIAEAAYVAKLAQGAWLSVDLQHIRNPAYNADRGPVMVGGVRLHLEY
jgi:high affinity Mn2+ porin